MPDAMNLLAIGASHFAAIQRAHETRVNWPLGRYGLTTIQVREKRFLPLTVAGKDGPEVNVELRSAISSALSGGSFRSVLCNVGGFEHTLLSLVNHPRRFDFILPSEEHLELSENAELLPYSAVIRVLRAHRTPFLTIHRYLRSITDLPIIQICPPPPIGNDQHIIAHPGIFGEKIKDLGLSPPVLRYKMWRSYLSILQRECTELGSQLIEPPSDAIEQGKYLSESYWGIDPTHGNTAYGELILRQIDQVVFEHAGVISYA